VEAIPEQPEVEPNDTPAQANPIKKLPATVVGTLGVLGDADYFSFDPAAGQTFVFDAAARSIGSKAALRLALFDAEGKLLRDQSEFDSASDPLMVYHFDRAGRYLIRIDDRMMAGGPEHKYKLTIGAIPYVVGCYPLSVASGKATDVELIGYNLPPGAKAQVQAGAPGEMAVRSTPANFMCAVRSTSWSAICRKLFRPNRMTHCSAPRRCPRLAAPPGGFIRIPPG